MAAAGLGETLSGGEFTVFAPTDDAFDALFTALGVTPDEFLARSDLANILLTMFYLERLTRQQLHP